ncbi:MAG: DUF2683 family protein [Candidatus ainarchaeum sp.]|jgi:hypothetical protein|nr:DUF2683 family protein [Candidatus ainarchaeum sp.]
MDKYVGLNIKINPYTNRVLGVIKEKYGLRDKGDALNKFVELFGDEFIDREIKEEVLKDVIKSCDYHIKKKGFKSKTISELRKSIEEK